MAQNFVFGLFSTSWELKIIIPLICFLFLPRILWVDRLLICEAITIAYHLFFFFVFLSIFTKLNWTLYQFLLESITLCKQIAISWFQFSKNRSNQWFSTKSEIKISNDPHSRQNFENHFDVIFFYELSESFMCLLHAYHWRFFFVFFFIRRFRIILHNFASSTIKAQFDCFQRNDTYHVALNC